jgi:hypothetical protein
LSQKSTHRKSLCDKDLKVGDTGLEPVTSCVSSIPLIENPRVFASIGYNSGQNRSQKS